MKKPVCWVVECYSTVDDFWWPHSSFCAEQHAQNYVKSNAWPDDVRVRPSYDRLPIGSEPVKENQDPILERLESLEKKVKALEADPAQAKETNPRLTTVVPTHEYLLLLSVYREALNYSKYDGTLGSLRQIVWAAEAVVKP